MLWHILSFSCSSWRHWAYVYMSVHIKSMAVTKLLLPLCTLVSQAMRREHYLAAKSHVLGLRDGNQSCQQACLQTGRHLYQATAVLICQMPQPWQSLWQPRPCLYQPGQACQQLLGCGRRQAVPGWPIPLQLMHKLLTSCQARFQAALETTVRPIYRWQQICKHCKQMPAVVCQQHPQLWTAISTHCDPVYSHFVMQEATA